MPRRKSSCSRQTTKKYTTRKSPPYAASDCCGETKIGNDGKEYTSVKVSSRSGDYCRWQLSAKKKADRKRSSNRTRKTKSKRSSTKRKTSTRKKSTRTRNRKQSKKSSGRRKNFRFGSTKTSRTWLGVVVSRKSDERVLIDPTAKEVKEALYELIREKGINIKVTKVDGYFYVIHISWKKEDEDIAFGVDFYFEEDQHNQRFGGRFKKYDHDSSQEQPFVMEIAGEPNPQYYSKYVTKSFTMFGAQKNVLDKVKRLYNVHFDANLRKLVRKK